MCSQGGVGLLQVCLPAEGSPQQEPLTPATIKKFSTGVFVYGVKLSFDLVLPNIWLVFLAFPSRANRCSTPQSSACARCRTQRTLPAAPAGRSTSGVAHPHRAPSQEAADKITPLGVSRDRRRGRSLLVEVGSPRLTSGLDTHSEVRGRSHLPAGGAPGPRVGAAVGMSPWLGHSPHVAAEWDQGWSQEELLPVLMPARSCFCLPFSWQLWLGPRVLFPQHCPGSSCV